MRCSVDGPIREADTCVRPAFRIACFFFLAVVLFTSGVGAILPHHHDPLVPDQHCLACRVLDTPASVSPPDAGPAVILVLDFRDRPPIAAAVLPATPASTPRSLRGPPTA